MNIRIRGEYHSAIISTEPAEAGLWLKGTYHVTDALRAVTPVHEVSLDKDDLLEFVFDDSDQTTWLCGTDSLTDLFPEAPVQTRSETYVFEIPATITPPVTERGIGSMISGVAIKIINIFAKKGLDNAVADIAGRLEEHQLGVSNIGLRQLKQDFTLANNGIAASTKPFLLFLHGTVSSTSGSFLGLTKNAALWQQLCQMYDGNMLAFQHRTLTESPLENVRQLVEALPDNAVLHLVSHSRGGLVGDILSRFCLQGTGNTGFSTEEMAYLDKCGRDADINTIGGINALMQKKRLMIARYIRVACPAAGTTLVSKRLDHFFNIVANLVGFATGGSGSIAYQLFRQLIGAIVSAKNDASVLPGLEAMDPESPFIKILNDQDFKGLIDTQLTVIAGNSKAKLNAKALVVIASKLFFQRNNDLIVNTGAMYRGARRLNDLQYFFDEGSDVDHFSYFQNERTQRILLEALTYNGTGAAPGFTYMTAAEAAAQRNAILNLDGGKLFMDKVTGTRPILVMLPGIMGSNLDVNGKSVWINYWKFITGELDMLAFGHTGIVASSIVGSSYTTLAKYLSDAYDVVTFPFDWRLQMNDCAELLNQKLLKLLSYNQPIKIIGHSLGGVLMRDFIINHPDTWQRLNASMGFHLVWLGAPLGGSFRIPAVLFGMDAIIKKIATLDIVHTKKELLAVFSQLPGLLSLLPLTDDAENDMANAAVWNKMRRGLGDNSWPIPADDRLAQFRNYRENIRAKLNSIDYSNISYVAGHDAATPCGYKIEQKAEGEELVFLSTTEGDQSVTWESGIPERMIAQNKVYYVEVKHGDLANTPSMFKGITDLLIQGSTLSFSKQRPVSRGGTSVFRTPQVHDFDFSAAGLEDTIMGLSNSETVTSGEAPVTVTVINGDLLYADYPVLAGHFNGDGILYAEQAIDNYLNGSLRQRHTLGLYPGPIGTSLTILTPQLKLPGAVIIGLDDPSSLTGASLTKSVEQGICDYLLHKNKQPTEETEAAQSGSPVLGISALIIGCGYGGLTVESSLTAILQGVYKANNKIRKLLDSDARTIGHVEFIEKYEDRALSGLHILDRISQEGKGLTISLSLRLKTRIGSQRRINVDTTGEWWNRISVKRVTSRDSSEADYLQFSSAAGGAKEDERNLYGSLELLDGLIRDISDNNAWSPQSARILFELMIPKDFKEQLKRQCNIIWVLDKDTAGYPWELLHDGANAAYPFSVSAGMVRQLSTTNSSPGSTAVMKQTALVIADPDLQGYISQLPAAKKEGEKVFSILNENDYATTLSVNESGLDVLAKLFTAEYKIVHIAGHGMFNPEKPLSSGLVIGEGDILSTSQFKQMGFVPDLMFVNCCYLGKMDGAAERLYADRYQLAANIGTQLIDNGVKAVIVCGWAVNDDAALAFSEVFYRCMFDGYSFGDAVRKARKHTFDNYENNTWGAYQCYGDPFYKLTITDSWQEDKLKEYNFFTSSEAETILSNLLNALDMPENDEATVRGKLAAISKAVDAAGVRTAAISEAEAFIYTELGDYDAAIPLLERLIQSEAKTISFAAAEKYCNIRGKKYVADYLKKPEQGPLLTAQMTGVIKDLDNLISFQATAERYNLLGSAWKCMAMLAQTPAARIEALESAALNYQLASKRKRSPYAVTNWLQTESLLVTAGQRKWKSLAGGGIQEYTIPSKADVDRQLKALTEQYSGNRNDMSYWELVALSNLKLCGAIINNSTHDKAVWEELVVDFKTIWVKAGSKQKKIAEQEHLNFLATMAYKFEGAAARRLYSRLEKLLEQI